jgi:hypothetical protein
MAPRLSPYAVLLDLAHQQADAAARGDLESAIALLGDRAGILATAMPTCTQDREDMREVMRLDRELASAIRRRMIDIRNEVFGLQNGRTALAGYRPPLGRPAPRRLNALG